MARFGAAPALRLGALRELSATVPETDSYEVAERALQDEHPDVRVGATWILALGCSKDPRVGASLRDLTQNDVSRDVRAAASEALMAVEILTSAAPT
ncbi:HEAT repeat domain-containing protein [Streptomyces nitrosporeus]|uniref:HEAT repeat domain-containing protein n=1 Tax=Streptomyces nitrosporeus TaxID=28894 RepID=UPI001E63151E|nr:HEAT repeat domain-containing protein [Streptomyces nitrosporeus]